jgi:RNA polymerase sigma-70 factor (ECF subfamily)
MLDPPDNDFPVARRRRFGALLADAQDRLFAYIRSLVRDFNDADDLFQQTAIILWRKFDAYDASRSFAGWAMGIARLEVSNFLRTRSRSRLYFSDELNLMLIEAHEDLSPQEAEQRKAALAECLEKLRERDRALLEQCYAGDATIVACAERLGRSSHSVHNTLRRLRRALFACIRQALSDSEGDSESMEAIA